MKQKAYLFMHLFIYKFIYLFSLAAKQKTDRKEWKEDILTD